MDMINFGENFLVDYQKKNNKKYIATFERWIKRSSNNYFDENLNGQRIKSIKIWSVSQKNADMGSDKQYNV